MSVAPQLVNPSFELAGLQVAGTEPSLTGWAVFDGQLTQDTAHVHGDGLSGRWSATVLEGFKVSAPTAPDFALGRLWGAFPEGERFEPWGVYTIQAWMLAEQACTASLRFGYIPNGVPTDSATAAPVALSPSTWTAVRASWTPQAAHEGPQVQVNPFLSVPGACVALWLDDIAVSVVGR